MLEAIVICFGYVALLLGISKLFGVKYTDIIKNTSNIRNGLFLPVGIGALLLTLYAWLFGWLPKVFSFAPRLESWVLWLIPLLFLVGSVARLAHARWQDFDSKGLLYLVFGTLFVGFSEELLVRGIVVSSLMDHGFSILATGVYSSLLFGLAHGINYFNGQDAKTTLTQMCTTTLFGIDFFVIYVVTGSLWAPIALHFLHDFTLLVQGGSVNKPKSKNNFIDDGIVLALLVLPLIAVFYI
jgi:membrane protease YdiL (CAAX protease family)